MLIIYSMIIILAFTIFGKIVLENYRTTNIKNKESRLFQTANIVGDIYKSNREDIISSRIMVKSYGHQSKSRILILDFKGEVIIDSYNTYMGQVLNNEEIRSSLKGFSKSGIYEIQDRETLQLAVPINLSIGYEKELIGAVLISSSMEDINKDIEDLRNNIFKVAIIALIISLVLTIIAATEITRPLRKLTYGVGKIASGDLEHRITAEGSKEIRLLIENFNEMGEKLSSIEKNRKSFINTISHELRTPLTSIKALIESLNLGDNTVDIYKEYLEDIKNETNRMENLVNYLMGSIKLEDTNFNIKEENLGEIVMDTVKFITPYGEKNNIEIKYDIDKDIIVKCDRDRIREMILNLMDNSIKYKDEKKEENYIIVRLKKSREGAILEIEDNGVGIDEGNLTGIFERNFRVIDHKEIDGKMIEGYGIGLALVKRIIDRHKWTIQVQSTIGQGSIFKINVQR